MILLVSKKLKVLVVSKKLKALFISEILRDIIYFKNFKRHYLFQKF